MGSWSNEILSEINTDLLEIINTDLKDTISDAHTQVVYDEWYNLYTPQYYVRRYVNKGLIDKNNHILTTEVEDICDIKVNFENITKSDEDYEKLLIPMIETEKVRPYNNYVDLIGLTEDKLEQENIIEETLENGLRKKGY